MMTAGYAIGADEGIIYCRAEYPLAIERINKAIQVLKAEGLLEKAVGQSGFPFKLRVKKGAGAFVCGEETALMASVEGRRGMPRPRPPFPSVAGLFQKPTIVNNVETMANVSHIMREGAESFAAMGTATSKGTKVFALTGKVVNTGLVEVPMGMTLREIVFDIGGGIPDGKEFKAVQIGGPSGGCIPAQHLDTQIDYESLKTLGTIMGSGGLVVMDQDTCMVDMARYFLSFITSESCGKCIPCREGTQRLYEVLDSIVSPYSEDGRRGGEPPALQQGAQHGKPGPGDQGHLAVRPWAVWLPTPFSPRFGSSRASTTPTSTTGSARPTSAKACSRSPSTRTLARAARCAQRSAPRGRSSGRRRRRTISWMRSASGAAPAATCAASIRCW